MMVKVGVVLLTVAALCGMLLVSAGPRRMQGTTPEGVRIDDLYAPGYDPSLAQKRTWTRKEDAEEDIRGTPTGQYAVKLAYGADPDEVASRHGFVNKGPIGSLKQMYLFEGESEDEDRLRGISSTLAADDSVTSMERQYRRKMEKR